jgi:hypothetical protein
MSSAPMHPIARPGVDVPAAPRVWQLPSINAARRRAAALLAGCGLAVLVVVTPTPDTTCPGGSATALTPTHHALAMHGGGRIAVSGCRVRP